MSVEQIIAKIPDKSDAGRQQMRTNAERWLASGTAPQKAAAKELLAALDAFDAADRKAQSSQAAAERKALVDFLRDKEPAERVIEAMRALPPSPEEEKAVRALLDNPGSTSTELSAACGWGGQIWHMRFGGLCRKWEIYLWPAVYVEHRDAGFYCGILADLEPPENRFTMKQDAAEAFAALGLKAHGK